MKRLLLCATVLLPLVSGQTRIDPAEAQAIVSRAGKEPLPCDVQAHKPALSLNSRLQSGYTFRASTEGGVTVLLRVTPAGGGPFYLMDRVSASASGAFFLGEGQYRFHLLLVDERGRSCVKDWQLDAAARGAKLAIAPGMVLDLALHGASPVPGGIAGRLTILLDAAPILAGASAIEEPAAWNVGGRVTQGREPLAGPRSAVMLRPGDQTLLLGALSAVVEQFAASEIRLVVFNLAQQKELFRGDRFTAAAISRVAEVLRDIQLTTVDYRVLVNPSGHHDLLANVINAELRSSPAADGVLFLGSHERFADDFPGKLLDRARRPTPPFFRLAYEVAAAPAMGANAITMAGIDVADDPAAERVLRRSADVVTTTRPDRLADPVTQAMRKLGGKTFAVRSPADFTRAIGEIRRRVIGSSVHQ